MKHLFTILLALVVATTCFGQFEKSTTFRATVNFNIVLDGLATNDAGIGVGLDASFFSQKRLQALLETSADRFIGDKLMVADPITGEETKSAAIYSVKAGPQFFITNNLALAVTYGPSWHVIRDFKYKLDYGLKYSVIGFFGAQKNFITKLFLVNIPVGAQKIQYIGIAAGYRF